MTTIVCAVDGGAEQPSAVALAGALAGATGATLIVANVYPWTRFNESLGNAYELTVREDAMAILKRASDQLRPVPHEVRAIAGLSAPKALHALCAETGADALVIGSCHRGRVGRTVLGGVGDRLVHGAPSPVVVAPRDYATTRGLQTIGVGYDGSDDARAALDRAIAVAEATGAALELIGVAEPVVPAVAMGGVAFPYEQVAASQHKACEDALREGVARVDSRVEVTTTTLDGPAGLRLAEAAAHLDLLVIGSRGYGPVRAVMIGTVGRALAHEAPCPLMIVPRTARTAADDEPVEAAAATA